ncbi:MAG: S46 family peptidase [Bacteroidia bacterium]
MKKASLLLVGLFIVNATTVFADEGMWLLMYLKKLNENKMQEMGLKLSADDIYSVNNSSLKDAIVSLGGFCSAEIVSEKGLMFTNHHCAYDAIAENSKKGDVNYIEEGFWARSLEEELPNEGLTASILVRMEDVTNVIRPVIDTVQNPMQRDMILSQLVDSIQNAATEGTHYNAQVKTMFYGNEYYLFIYETFRDVRLVAAPPSSIGKFGGDTDNWMWPRHTGDFAMLRIYTAPDGTPADFSDENIPYKPKHHLPISLKGVDSGTFSMIMGFPGSTQRYLTSYDIKLKYNQTLPAYKNILGKILEIMKTDMDADSVKKLTMASKYASLSNAHKYFIGQHRGLTMHDLVAEKQEDEKAFNQWINATENRREKYGDVFSKMEEAYNEERSVQPAVNYYLMSFNTETFSYGVSLYRLGAQMKQLEKKEDLPEASIERAKQSAEDYFNEAFLSTERKLMKALLLMFYENVPADQQPEYISEILDKAKGDTPEEKFNSYVDDMFDKGLTMDKDKYMSFLKKPKQKKLEKDPLYQLITNVITTYQTQIAPTFANASQIREEQQQLYLEALRKYKADEVFYPDANSTIRLSFGEIMPYEPRDAVKYKYYTTYEGILEKEDPEDDEFMVPEKLLDLLEEGDFGRYAMDDTLRVNFLTNHDITGGNSGSPVLDGEGNLIGIAFDGNWEAMIGDILVVPSLNRTISVDIRYVLFIIDKYANAQNIIAELDIIEAKQPEKNTSQETQQALPAEAETEAPAEVR